VLRPAGFVFLSAVFLSALAASGCGATSLTPADSGAAGEGGPTVDIPGVTGLVAQNGLPIPDPPLHDPCTALAPTAMDCVMGACPAVTCDCGGGPKPVELQGVTSFTSSCDLWGRCLTGVSCPGVCSTSDFGASELSKCAVAGVCETDADCTKPGMAKCLLAPDGTAGHCVSGQGGSDCYRDSDCASGGCVGLPYGTRACQDVNKATTGAICNRNDQCPAGPSGIHVCLLGAADIFGPCTNGAIGSECLANGDCVPGATCLMINTPTYASVYGSCTTGEIGTPCGTTADCKTGLCVGANGGPYGFCRTGAVSSICNNANDCQPGLRCAPGDPQTCQP
jgi:hypothetical protein